MLQAAGRAGAVLTIDLQALRHNYRLLKAKAGAARCGAVVKADAYGLGMSRVAPVLAQEGCQHFFVAHLAEAIALRDCIPAEMQVIVMHGAPIGYEAEFLKYNCTPVLNSARQVAAWRDLASTEQRELAAIIQIDTGMSRMGLSALEVQAWLADPDYLRGIRLHYLMSHLACAETQQHPMNQQQLQSFQSLLTRLQSSGVKCGASLANSSGIFLGEPFQFDLVRPGSALYGVAPVAGAPNPMQAVALLQGKIIQTREIAAGVGVGYGQTYCAQQTRRIATVAVGYADGWLRSLSNRGVAAIGGQTVPVVGNVSMDLMTLDVTEIASELLHEGALVDLLSADLTVDQVAQQAGTIAYEILTSLGTRYERHYRD